MDYRMNSGLNGEEKVGMKCCAIFFMKVWD